MTWPPWLCRLVPYLGRRRAEQDLREELRLHLELERERQRDTGVPESEALRAARRTLGNALLIRERTRDVWGWCWLDDLGRDLRHAARGLGRNPGFAATVVLVLALGIGANTAVFSVVYGMLIRPLPYLDDERIVRVGQGPQRVPGAPLYLSAHALAQLQEAADSFEQLAAYGGFTHWSTGPDGRVLWGAPVSPALLRLLGARPHLGRLFTNDEARAGADGVVLLSHRAWTRRFGSNPEIIGTVIDVYNEPRTVVGVLAEGFYFPSSEEEVWTPYVLRPTAPTVVVLGRLREGFSAAQAATEARTILRTMDGLPAQHSNGGRTPGHTPEIDAGVIRVLPLREEMVGGYRPALRALSMAAAVMLLIACVNVAGLLLARGVTRQRTLTVCAALGAGRGRIVRQLLTESMVLSLSGGVLGLAAAAVLLRTLPALVPGNIVRLDDVGLNGVAFAFTFGLSLAVGLMFGLAPALQWSGSHMLRAVTKGSEPSSGGFRPLRANGARAVLAAAQVALALVLLVGAGLLLRSFVTLLTVDRGYDPANVLAATVRNPALPSAMGAQEDEVARRRLYGELVEGMGRLSRLPQVAAVGVSSALPLAGSGSIPQRVHVVGHPAPSEESELPEALLHMVSPGYFDVMGLRLLEGRPLTSRDSSGAPRVLVVNETFVREVLSGVPGVGQQVRFVGNGADDEPWEVIGVVADVNYRGLAVRWAAAEALASVGQIDGAPAFALNFPFVAVRTTGEPLATLAFLRETVADVRAGASLAFAMTMDARLSTAIAQPRFYAFIAALFAALALLLAASGIYGLLSYMVAQRRGEIGIRMALGAQHGDVFVLVVKQGAALVVCGTIVGLGAAAVSSRVLRSLLYGIVNDDLLILVAAPLALLAVALVACWLPARRATRVDPMDALRFE